MSRRRIGVGRRTVSGGVKLLDFLVVEEGWFFSLYVSQTIYYYLRLKVSPLPRGVCPLWNPWWPTQTPCQWDSLCELYCITRRRVYRWGRLEFLSSPAPNISPLSVSSRSLSLPRDFGLWSILRIPFFDLEVLWSPRNRFFTSVMTLLIYPLSQKKKRSFTFFIGGCLIFNQEGSKLKDR